MQYRCHRAVGPYGSDLGASSESRGADAAVHCARLRLVIDFDLDKFLDPFNQDKLMGQIASASKTSGC
jgi:hypothetical protein